MEIISKMEHISVCVARDRFKITHTQCECECHDRVMKGTNFEVYEDANIENPPEWVTWYPTNDPRASWNLPK